MKAESRKPDWPQLFTSQILRTAKIWFEFRSYLGGFAKYVTSTLVCLGLVQAANAMVWVHATNVAQVQYQTAGNFIYFRNLNQFNSSALGCCYNYWIDTSTVEGRNIFALVLSAAAQGTALYFGVSDGYASGVVSYVGVW
jgi:hypothetical protein